MLMRAATVVQVLQDLFYVLLHVLFYLWSLLNTGRSEQHSEATSGTRLNEAMTHTPSSAAYLSYYH